MSTFNPPADIAQITLAKSSDVNAIKAATAIAFGLLPSETKLQRGTVNFAVDTGTANAYVVALDASITTYTDGLQVVFRPLNSNSGTSTINLNGLGAKSIRLTDSNPISAGDISAGAVIDVRYSTATGFFHLTPNSAIYAADAGVSADAAAASALAASSSASAASSSASSASSSASAASSSASNAASSASTATTQAGIATTQASLATTNGAAQVALATTQATNASTSATTATTQANIATTQAGIATTQATNASTSATTATTQAGIATTQATNAASSATAAAASYDSFDDRYLGSKASDPTLDNDGNALLTGALYWNSTSSVMKVYSGSAWSAAYVPSSNYLALTGGTMTGAITFAAGQFGTNVNTFLTTPTSANLAAALTDETGTGVNVFNNSPTLITPILGTPQSGNLANCTFPTLNQNTTGTAAGLSAVLAIASGGTNSTATPTAGGVGYGTGTAHAFTAAGTAGQVLTSAGAGAPTWSTPAAATKTISNKTGAYTVVIGDLGSIINCTSGTFTVSLTAAASLGSGFTCTIWNTGTGAITIDPNAAETIDGVATLILRQGEGLAVVCNGTNWETDDKKPMRGYAESLTSTSSRPVASGVNSIALGIAYASGVNSFSAVINDSSGTYGALGDGDIAVGSLAKASGSGYVSIALGRSTVSTGNNTIAIGRSNSATSNYSTAIGSNSGNTGSQAVTGAGAMALGGSYASGTDSFAAAIGNNTSSYGATGANGVAIGRQAKVTGANSLSLGYLSVASGATSTVLGGLQSQATGDYSVALGNNAKAAQYGKYAYSSSSFGVAGTSQSGKIVLRAETTTTTAVVLTSDGGAASTTNQLIVDYDKAMAIQGTLIAKAAGTGAMAGWNITGIVLNNGGTMVVSGLALTAIGSDSITLGAQPTIAVDNTNLGVKITSGYKSALTIRWVATLNTSEVSA